MKTFTAISLLSAALLPNLAAADVNTLTENRLRNVTGQAEVNDLLLGAINLDADKIQATVAGLNVSAGQGIKIDIDTRMIIGDFRYTDEGSFVMKEIILEGSTPGTLLDDVEINLDISSANNVIVHVGSSTSSEIDFGLRIKEISLESVDSALSTTLMSNLSVSGALESVDAVVQGDTSDMATRISFVIDDMDVDIDFLAIGIRDMSITRHITPTDSSRFLELNLTLTNIKHADAANGKAVKIELGDVSADVKIGSIEIGGTSIGSLELNKLEITNTYLLAYEH